MALSTQHRRISGFCTTAMIKDCLDPKLSGISGTMSEGLHDGRGRTSQNLVQHSSIEDLSRELSSS